MNHLKLVVDNQEEVSSEEINHAKAFENLQSYAALFQVLNTYPILQKNYSLGTVKNKIEFFRSKVLSTQHTPEPDVVELVKSQYGAMLDKNPLHMEFIDYCKSIGQVVICSKEINFEIQFSFHVIIGRISQYRLNEDQVALMFIGVNQDGKKITSVLISPQFIEQEDLDQSPQLKDNIINTAIQSNMGSLNEPTKQVLCKSLGVPHMNDNVIEFPTHSAKVLNFRNGEENQADDEGPFAG